MSKFLDRCGFKTNKSLINWFFFQDDDKTTNSSTETTTSTSTDTKPVYSLMFPLLEPSYAVSKIFKAMSRRTAVLMMPRACYVTPVVNDVLPTILSDAIMDFFNGESAKDELSIWVDKYSEPVENNTTTTNGSTDKNGTPSS